MAKGDKVYVYFCYDFMLFAFLSPPHHPHSPITMRHLACYTFFNYLQKQHKQRLACWFKLS